MEPSPSQPSSCVLDETQNEPSFQSKRSLLRAAWVPPVVFALSLPHASYAANISGTDKHANQGKDDKGKAGGDNNGKGKNN
jgi:hypothetical protein